MIVKRSGVEVKVYFLFTILAIVVCVALYWFVKGGKGNDLRDFGVIKGVERRTDNIGENDYFGRKGIDYYVLVELKSGKRVKKDKYKVEKGIYEMAKKSVGKIYGEVIEEYIKAEDKKMENIN